MNAHRSPLTARAMATGVAVLLGGVVVPLSAAPARAAMVPTPVPGCNIAHLASTLTTAVAGSTIHLSGICTGNFTIAKNLTLDGPAILDGGGAGTVLTVTAGNVVLNQLTIRHGVASPSAACSGKISRGAGLCGGGVLIEGGSVTLNGCTVSNNSAGAYGPRFSLMGGAYIDYGSGAGGGIAVMSGTAVLNHTTVSGNIAKYGDGGGIANSPIGRVTLENGSTVSGNTAEGSYPGDNGAGGGISNGGIGAGINGIVTILHSTVSGNSAGWIGGGIYNGGTVALTDSTVTGNHAGLMWGGITAMPYTVLVQQGSTVSGNIPLP